jgi:hypothetical protein
MVWRTIPVLEFMIKTWKNMAGVSRFGIMRDTLTEGLENLGKWYMKADDSTAYFIYLGIIHCQCLVHRRLIFTLPHSVLDPNFKVVYAQHHWDNDSFDAGLKVFERVVSINN